jgi:uncharacterized protein (DUF1501 family)
MFNRRDFLSRTLQGTSLLAAGTVVPQFLANTAQAAGDGKDTILVVIEMTGGNDGLNTVIPYADDLYHKARPTLRFTKQQVVRVDDHIGLHPAMRRLEPMLKAGNLAIVQGVGYPNPDRSHFESMDVWQSADPHRKAGTGWIGRSVPDLQDRQGNIPVMQMGPNRLPLALQGGPGGVVSIDGAYSYKLEVGDGDQAKQKARRKLLEDLAQPTKSNAPDDLLQFVQRRQVQTYTTLDRMRAALGASKSGQNGRLESSSFGQKLDLIVRLIRQDVGTRVYYLAVDGFDTHSGQAPAHEKLLGELATGLAEFFQELETSKHDKRVVALTFSEFGRRVQENGSKGTDHGAASCLFVAGPAVKGGAVGAHPSLKDLDSGDLKHHTDFRRVYATLLDRWLGCSSRTVLGGAFEPLDMFKSKA